MRYGLPKGGRNQGSSPLQLQLSWACKSDTLLGVFASNYETMVVISDFTYYVVYPFVLCRS